MSNLRDSVLVFCLFRSHNLVFSHTTVCPVGPGQVRNELSSLPEAARRDCASSWRLRWEDNRAVPRKRGFTLGDVGISQSLLLPLSHHHSRVFWKLPRSDAACTCLLCRVRGSIDGECTWRHRTLTGSHRLSAKVQYHRFKGWERVVTFFPTPPSSHGLFSLVWACPDAISHYVSFSQLSRDYQLDWLGW